MTHPITVADDPRRLPADAGGAPSRASLKELIDGWVTPPDQAGSLVRPRLLEILDDALRHRLTLICAAPGAGKTVLLAQWAASLSAVPGRTQVAWLTLGPECHSPSVLALALEVALRRAGALIEPLTDKEQSSLTPEAVLARLTVSPFAEPTLLILDGLEQLGALSQALLAYLVEQAPPQLQLVLATRGEALTLPALCWQRPHLELGDEDLRWSRAEAHAWLNGALRLGLSQAEVSALVERTAGWSAGLRLAALGLRARSQGREVELLGGAHRRLVATLAGGVGAAPAAAGRVASPHGLQPPRHGPDGPLALEALSDRERQIVALIAAGLPNREIAGRLWISEGTVKTHLKRTFAKLGARNRTEAVAIARRQGVIPVL
jgi:ATP/maltotriose-dependent transcriptional regulator MalT